MPTNTIFMGEIPLGKLFFVRLENAFLLAESNSSIEVVSDFDNLESELSAWCCLKGEKFLQKAPLKHCFSYLLLKQSQNAFQPLKTDSILSTSPSNFGLTARDSLPQVASPEYDFILNNKESIWSENLTRLYEDAKRAQWNATSEIEWNAIPTYEKTLEFAIAQVMTYLVENEFSALYVPSKFLSKISPYYTEVPLLLSSIIGDKARHIEVFIKRAKATGLGLQYSTLTTQQSLYTLFREENYFVSSFLLHIMGEGTFVDLLYFLEEHILDAPTKKLLRLARKDEMRHVAYGMTHIKQSLSSNPNKIFLLKRSVLERRRYLDESSGESTLLLESLAVIAGGGDMPNAIKKGFEALEELKHKMEENRTKRLVECGIDEDLARELSKSHTPNFM
ncbi:ferritin-like domain-containing protein [Helicobacter sp. MIT 11-5569]|uniref:ferritin-like domain-containing protein n=1 Tax=Helicobacter sp. MIT 11-5569 TaxID=1548151 RepID=UPI00051F99B4|nr:ferritin-like domain-containing protein [Helicobacter sp. MIT 11-5569]TLD84518.1 ferritin-like domain-containing protein [Helicobacter sp. MIT 11-5569]